MLSLRKPSQDMISSFLAAQAKLDFTYPAGGATASLPPAGFVVDHTRGELGRGPEVFKAARAALRRWEHFRLGWVEALPPDTPLEPGRLVAVLARLAGCWWLNACRIVYVVDEEDRFGFAYGTLPGHVESGEERFLVEKNQPDESIFYDILAFSRPRHVLARLGYPLARKLQKRFGRDSLAAMRRAAATAGNTRA
jgi:uncharacterized protein (UPF0548 family)